MNVRRLHKIILRFFTEGLKPVVLNLGFSLACTVCVGRGFLFFQKNLTFTLVPDIIQE